MEELKLEILKGWKSHVALERKAAYQAHSSAAKPRLACGHAQRHPPFYSFKNPYNPKLLQFYRYLTNQRTHEILANIRPSVAQQLVDAGFRSGLRINLFHDHSAIQIDPVLGWQRPCHNHRPGGHFAVSHGPGFAVYDLG